MQRFLILITNCALLGFLFIAIPAATHAQLGNWQISSASTARSLMFWGLATAAAGNALAALLLIKGRKERRLGWEWAAVFAGLLGVHYAYLHGCFNFDWLKQTLLWFQKHF